MEPGQLKRINIYQCELAYLSLKLVCLNNKNQLFFVLQ